MFPEAKLDPPCEAGYCRCDKREDAIAVERYMRDLAISAEWKGKIGHSITDDIMGLLDDYYVYGQCGDCKDEKEAD